MTRERTSEGGHHQMKSSGPQPNVPDTDAWRIECSVQPQLPGPALARTQPGVTPVGR